MSSRNKTHVVSNLYLFHSWRLNYVAIILKGRWWQRPEGTRGVPTKHWKGITESASIMKGTQRRYETNQNYQDIYIIEEWQPPVSCFLSFLMTRAFFLRSWLSWPSDERHPTGNQNLRLWVQSAGVPAIFQQSSTLINNNLNWLALIKMITLSNS